MKKLLLVAGLGLGLTTAALATPISGSMQVDPAVTLGSTTVSSTDSASWAGAPGALSVSATATLQSNGIASTFSNGSATWAADGNSGTVNLQAGMSSDRNGATGLAANSLGASNWEYTFLADSDGTFYLSYDVSFTGNGFGLWGWFLNQNFDSTTGGMINDVSDPTEAGVLIGQITAGNVYTIGLIGNANVSSTGEFSWPESVVSGAFSWRIAGNSVPEGGAVLPLFAAALASVALLRRRVR